MRPIRYVVMILLLSGCSMLGFGKSLVVTGESLKGVGNEFVQVSAVYKKGCDVDKTIAQPQCQNFRTFGEKFQKTFPLTVQLWEAARASNDKNMQGKVEEVIVDLATALSEFAVAVIPAKK